MKTSSTMFIIANIFGWVWMLGIPVWIICLILYFTSSISIWWAIGVSLGSLFAKGIRREYLKEATQYSMQEDQQRHSLPAEIFNEL